MVRKHLRQLDEFAQLQKYFSELQYNKVSHENPLWRKLKGEILK